MLDCQSDAAAIGTLLDRTVPALRVAQTGETPDTFLHSALVNPSLPPSALARAPSLAARQGQLPCGSARGSRTNPGNKPRLCSARYELFFGIEREFDHSLEQLLRGDAREVLQHQLLDVQAHEAVKKGGMPIGNELSF